MIAFKQDFQADFDAILAEQDPFCLVRFGDGELALVCGKGHQSADVWRTTGPVWLRGALIESLCFDAPGYCVATVPPCCLQSGIRLRTAVRVPRERQTMATLFMNGNLKRTQELMMRYGNAVVVSSWFGDEQYRIPADGVTAPWDLDGLVAKLLEVDRPILLAAGPCANLIALRYWQRQKPDKRQTILDVGSALDVLHGKYSRACHTLKSDHMCTWQGIEYVAATRSSRTRAIPQATTSPTPQPNALRIGAQRSVTPQPMATKPAARRSTTVTKVGGNRTRSAPPPLARETTATRRTGARSIRQIEGMQTKTRTREVISRARSQPTEAIHVGRSVIRSRAAPPSATVAAAAHAPQSKAAAVVVTKRPWLSSFVAQNLGWQTTKPEFVLVATACADYDISPIKAALPDATIDLVPVSSDLSLGELRNLAMSLAAEQVDDDFLLCTFDDDDLYGPDYIAGLLDAFGRHPSALIIGRASFQGIDVAEAPRSPPTPNPRVRKGFVPGVAGSTISVPARTWRTRDEFRYPPVAVGEDVALQAIARRERGIISANFGDFSPLRWQSAEHEHTSPNNHGAVPIALVQDDTHQILRRRSM